MVEELTTKKGTTDMSRKRGIGLEDGIVSSLKHERVLSSLPVEDRIAISGWKNAAFDSFTFRKLVQ